VRCDFGYCGHYWPIVPAPDDTWLCVWRNWWNEDWQWKPKYSEKTCPSSATLSTTNPTRLDPGLNPGRSGGKPATNRLSYGAASFTRLHWQQMLKQRFSSAGTSNNFLCGCGRWSIFVAHDGFLVSKIIFLVSSVDLLIIFTRMFRPCGIRV
jgi:hypothetical protein